MTNTHTHMQQEARAPTTYHYLPQSSLVVSVRETWSRWKKKWQSRQKNLWSCWDTKSWLRPCDTHTHTHSDRYEWVCKHKLTNIYFAVFWFTQKSCGVGLIISFSDYWVKLDWVADCVTAWLTVPNVSLQWKHFFRWQFSHLYQRCCPRNSLKKRHWIVLWHMSKSKYM